LDSIRCPIQSFSLAILFILRLHFVNLLLVYLSTQHSTRTYKFAIGFFVFDPIEKWVVCSKYRAMVCIGAFDVCCLASFSIKFYESLGVLCQCWTFFVRAVISSEQNRCRYVLLRTAVMCSFLIRSATSRAVKSVEFIKCNVI
jgi:hypothetical protein